MSQNNRQDAARRLIEHFVTKNGGKHRDIYREEQSYRWTAPDGRVAAIGWE